MTTITLEYDEHNVCTLLFSSGRGNPLTPTLVEEFNQVMDTLLEQPPRALIIHTSGAPIFSGGFALPIIASWAREDIDTFFRSFLDIVYKIMTIPCATISVIEGHAIAGGFILSLATDQRFIKEGRSKFGLSEVDLGVALPAGAGVLFSYRCTPRSAQYHSMSGRLFNTQRALEIGYADTVCADPMKAAKEEALFFAKKPGFGSGLTRVIFNDVIIKEMKAADELFMERFLDSWFSKEGQQSIHALAAKLSKPK